MMNDSFSRQDFYRNDPQVLHKGKWANADVIRGHQDGRDWVMKDFSGCPFIYRHTLAKLVLRRELKILSRLQGLPGIPENPIVVDGCALVYHYIPGKALGDARKEGLEIGEDFFEALEDLVSSMHERRVVHLDLRNTGNILITDDGAPGLLDFQAALFLGHLPRFIHPLLKNIDFSGVYKHWHKMSPDTLGSERLARLKKMNGIRKFWLPRGYPIRRTLKRAKKKRRPQSRNRAE